MISKIYLVCNSDFYYKNRIFDLSSIYNRDNAWHPMYLLKQRFKAHGVELLTYDYWQKEDKDYALLFSDYSKLTDYHDNSVNKYLIITESEIICPANRELQNHQEFHKIFTWHDDFVDNKKYFKLNFSQQIITDPDFDPDQKTGFCTLIAANKQNSHPLELYSQRIAAINWFTENHPAEFDFYGFGWDKYQTTNRYLNFLLRKSGLAKALAPKYKSYRGTVGSKRETMARYKFAICYENAQGIPGYITEKIMDCFFAACVPVYWGPDNICDHIPAACFIDKREFATYEELYDFLSNMADAVYCRYIDNIRNFLNSEKIHQFSSEYFADTLVRQILAG